MNVKHSKKEAVLVYDSQMGVDVKFLCALVHLSPEVLVYVIALGCKKAVFPLKINLSVLVHVHTPRKKVTTIQTSIMIRGECSRVVAPRYFSIGKLYRGVVCLAMKLYNPDLNKVFFSSLPLKCDP